MASILLSWVGAADLEGGSTGPVASILRQRACNLDRVVLLVNQSLDAAQQWASELPVPVDFVFVDLGSPIDYLEVFEATRRVIEEHIPADADLCINLTSGTKTMAACLLLLGRSVRHANFVQTHEGHIKEEVVPSVLIECIPEVLQAQQSALGSILSQDIQLGRGFDGITGKTPQIQLCVQKASRIAPLSYSVLLLGETGVGKEVFARAIHQSSARADQPFVAVNCASIPRDLQESELFGHVKGAFTGATSDRKGLFTEADGGTLFLDEFGELSPSTQASLLRALQPESGRPLTERIIRKLGGAADERVDVRIVAATNRALREVRQDLIRRLPFILELPPLRDRRSDLPALIQQFLVEIAHELNAVSALDSNGPFEITDAGLQLLMRHPWPGNIRELRNCLAEACVYSGSSTLDVPVLKQCLHSGEHTNWSSGPELVPGFDVDEHLAAYSLEIYNRAIESHATIKAAAASLGLNSDQKLRDRVKSARAKLDSA